MNKPKFYPLDYVCIKNVPSSIDNPQDFLYKVGQIAFVVASDGDPAQYFYILTEAPFLFAEKDLTEVFNSVARVPFFRLGEVVQVVSGNSGVHFGETAEIYSIEWNQEGNVRYGVEFDDGTQRWYYCEELNSINRKVNLFRHKLDELTDYTTRETQRHTVIPLKSVLALAQNFKTLPDHF